MNFKSFFIIFFSVLFLIFSGLIQVEAQNEIFHSFNADFLPEDIVDVYLPFGRMYRIPENAGISGYLKKAYDYEKAGNLRQAYRFYSYAYQRVRNSPASPYILFKRAYTVEDEKSFIKELKNILLKYPAFPLNNAVKFELSLFLYINESFDKSLYYIDKIVQSDDSPFVPYALTLKASIYIKKGNCEKATYYFFKSLSNLKSTISDGIHERQVMNNYIGLAICYYKEKKFKIAEIILRKVYGTSIISEVREKALCYLYNVFRESNRNNLALMCFNILKRNFPESIYLAKIKEISNSDHSNLQNVSEQIANEDIGIIDKSILKGIDNINELIIVSSGVQSNNKKNPENNLYGKFAVQIGSFKDENNAKKIKQRVLQYNYPVYIERIKNGENVHFRVRVGPFETKDKAVNTLKELQKFNFKGYVVQEK